MTTPVQAPPAERERELAALDRALAAARDGEGAGVLVEGPPGIGKTRLLATAREQASGDLRVLAARGSELERDFAFAIVRQLLEPPLREPGAAELLTGAAALAEPVLAEGHAAEPAAALHGLYWLTANLAARAPLLVIVDDLQWADAPSLRWLAYVAQRLDGLPAAIVAACRPAEAGDVRDVTDSLAANPAVELVQPAALGPAGVGQVLEHALGARAEPRFAEACRRATGGNPFLLEELARELAAGALAPTDANAGLVERQSSRTVGRAALARLRRLPPAAQALARAVAILGDDVDLALAAEVAGSDMAEAREAADALAAAWILAPGRPLAFAHPLVRTSVSTDLAAGERSSAHARAAALLRTGGAPAERVALHLQQADPCGDAEAVEILREAAREARRRGATEVAVSHLRRALREPPPGELVPALRHELGSAELQAGELATAADDLRHAVAGLDEPRAAGAAALELALALQLANRGDEAVAMLTAVAAALPEDERELGLRIEAARFGAGQGSLAAFEAVRAAPARFTADPDAPATAGECLFVAALASREVVTGRADRARELAVRALTGAARLDEARADGLFYIGAIATLARAGGLVEATQALDSLLDRARREGSAVGFAQASHTRAAIGWRRGDLLEAEADAEHALAHPGFMVRGGVIALVEVKLAGGDAAGARALWHERGMDDEPADARAAPITLSTRAHLHAAAGKHEQALADLRECGRIEGVWGTRTPADSWWRSDAVTLLASLGRREEARALSGEDLERCRAFGEPRALGAALRAAGLAHGEPELLRASVEAFASSPARLEHAISLLELGAALRRAGHRTDARAPLRDALELARACHAGAVAARARDELVAAGARPHRDPVDARTRLTASERRVARMAAEGMTNREIAQSLFLTEKTIEYHLTSVYRKLDIASRSQLARALAAAG